GKFDLGRCRLTAGAATLSLYVEAESAEALNETKEVVAGHLERFAVKDNLKVSWLGNDTPTSNE
ncbi:MAG: DUF2218 domain-containing protein, partial [Chloroflexota bacterium]